MTALIGHSTANIFSFSWKYFRFQTPNKKSIFRLCENEQTCSGQDFKKMNSANLCHKLQPKILCFSLPARLIGPQLMQRSLPLLGFLFCFFLADGQKVTLVQSLHVGLQKEHGRPGCRQACWVTHIPDLEWWRTVADSESCICKLSTFCFLRNSRLISASKLRGGGERCTSL